MRRRLAIAPAALAAALGFALGPRAAPTAPSDPASFPRRGPEYPASIMDRCACADRELLDRRIVGALVNGTRAYDAGDVRGCYALYERTARAIETSLSAACSGPVRALRTGRDSAATAGNDQTAVWALRDTFDGLLRALGRSANLPPLRDTHLRSTNHSSSCVGSAG